MKESDNVRKIYCVIIMITALLSGCYDMREPNNIAYVVAVGIDKAAAKNYDITIQFAKPVDISGNGEGGGSGENITENITITAPSLFAALTTANQLVSKKFDMSHAKLIVFSEAVARDGISNFMEAMSRNSEIRPNIYMAVALGSANEYLKSVKPLIEINPVKYYQLIYENYNSVYAPNDLSIDFYFSESSDYSESVLPLAGVLPENTDSGGDNSSDEGDSSDEKDTSSDKTAGTRITPQFKDSGFQFYMANYIPGELPKETKNKSEVIGMALFSDDKMKNIMGSADCEIYNMIKGTYNSTYVPFKYNDTDDIISMKIEANKNPDIKVDTSGDIPKITLKMNLEGEITSVPHYLEEESNIIDMENMMKCEMEKAILSFLYKISHEYDMDICGFGNYAKRNFLTNRDFSRYSWREKYKNADFDVDVQFKIRRSGLILRNSVEIK